MIENEEMREQLKNVGRYMMDHNLAWGNAGNISARIRPEQFLITASGTYLGELSDHDFVQCTLQNNHHTHQKKPSKELPMHQAVYEERADIQAVLHASPFYSTLAACSRMDIAANLFVETMYYLERIERVPYFHPGSKGLAEAVREKAPKANVLLLENHGVLVYDKSLKEARMGLQTLEMACMMLATAQKSGIPLKGLPPSMVEDFLEHSAYRPRRRWNSG